MSDVWEAYALKYAERNNRMRADSFIMDDDHASPHPLDYFVWLLRNGDETILVDTGFDQTEARNRERPILDSPADMLGGLGVSAEQIDRIILTHLHYDHAGDLTSYPNATLYLQEAEMVFATGPCMCHDHMRMPFTGEHICDAVRCLYDGRLNFVQGTAEIAPGVETHWVGGHSRGLQFVRVRTERGWVVLASDATHYYENYRTGKPFPIIADMEEVQNGYRRLGQLAESDDHIIPGHDPLVRTLYPRLEDRSDRIVVLHKEPQS